MVGVGRHGVAATKNLGGGARPSQLIASVGPTRRGRGEGIERLAVRLGPEAVSGLSSFGF